MVAPDLLKITLLLGTNYVKGFTKFVTVVWVGSNWLKKRPILAMGNDWRL